MKYEIMLILSPKLTDKETEKTLKEIKDTIHENGGKIFAEDLWGKRDMAYRIAGHSTGNYIVLNFEADQAGIPEIQKDLRIQAGLLRNMLIKIADGYKLEKFDETPTERSPRKLQTRQAEELSKKVSTRKKTEVKTEKVEEVKDSKLEEKLSAIVNDADIDI